MAKYPTLKKPSELDYPLLKKNTLRSFPDDADGRPGFGVSGEHGPKPSEVYGFVGSITTVVSTEPGAFHGRVRLRCEPNRLLSMERPAFVDGKTKSQIVFAVTREDDKAKLVEQTGLQLKQINNWFINQRKRNWHTNSQSASSLKSKRKR